MVPPIAPVDAVHKNVPNKGIDVKVRLQQGAEPAISYTPVDTKIPPALYGKIPNLDLYKKLEEAERKIDVVSARKSLHFQTLNAKTNQILSSKREEGILRVFVYNTCENQPWQKQMAQENNQPLADPAAEPSWTLRVEGRFLFDDKNVDLKQNASRFQFSSFLSAISIDLIPNDDYPEMQNSPANVVEWKNPIIDNVHATYQASAKNSDFDGIDTKRNGVFPLKLKIALMIKEVTPKLKLSDQLSYFVGKKEATQQEVIYLIWQYVVYKDLFNADSFSNVPAVSGLSGTGLDDMEGGEDSLRIINCDAILTELLGVSSFKFNDLYKLLQHHFKPRDPIIVDYEIDTKRSSTLGDLIIDIPVELPFSVSQAQKELIDNTKETYEKLSSADAKIQELNSAISLGIVSLQNSNARENFYRELSDDPVEFMKNWLKTQLETFKALKSDEGYDEEVVRRADYFKENEELLKEKIDVLLGAGRF